MKLLLLHHLLLQCLLLPNLLLLEPHRPPEGAGLRLWLRLVGTECVEKYGREITGRYLDEVYIAEDYDDTLAQFEAVLHTGHAACMWAETETHDGRAMNYERMLMPLADNGHDIDMILAMVVFLPVPAVAKSARLRQAPLASRLRMLNG